MRTSRQRLCVAAALIALGAGAWYWFHLRPVAATEQTGKPSSRAQLQVVKSALAISKNVAIKLQANGYVTPFNTVEVRPLTQNIVRAVHVTEGQNVHAGQLLFTLDERSDNANLDKARAQLARDRADVADADANLKRNLELAEKKFVSAAVVDAARNRLDGLRSVLRADQAAIESSAITLGNNQIKASISGRIGSINVHAGSLAQPAGTPLLTISQIDPVAITFAVPERELTLLNASYPNGDAPVNALTANGTKLQGKLIFIDSSSDAQSGTIKMKAAFANRDQQLWPGTYVNVELVSCTLTNAVVIPAQAVVTGPADKSVYQIQPDSSVTPRNIKIVYIDNGEAVVTGIEVGTRIVIEGSQNLRPGGKVKEAADDKAVPASSSTPAAPSSLR